MNSDYIQGCYAIIAQIAKAKPGLEFNQLDEDVREGLIADHREFLAEMNDWWDFQIDDWKEKQAELGFPDAKITFSLSYSQGDHAAFECKRVDVYKFITAHHLGHKYRSLLNIINNGWTVDMSVNCGRGGYTTVEGETDYRTDIVERENRVAEQIYSLAATIRAEVEDYGKQIYRELQTEWEYISSDKAISEYLQDCYYFTPDGAYID